MSREFAQWGGGRRRETRLRERNTTYTVLAGDHGAVRKHASHLRHESSRYCPLEDHNQTVANVPNWNWQNPFTAFKCDPAARAPSTLSKSRSLCLPHVYLVYWSEGDVWWFRV